MLNHTKHMPWLILLLSGCATLSKQECLQSNWEIIGQNDGANGRPLNYLDQHRQACSEYRISPDAMAYERGRNRGLLNYCTESRGYSVGASAIEFDEVCPEPQRQEFIKGYLRGLDQAMADVEWESFRKSQDLVFKTLEISHLKGKADDSLTNQLKQMRDEVENLYERGQTIRHLKQKYASD